MAKPRSLLHGPLADVALNNFLQLSYGGLKCPPVCFGLTRIGLHSRKLAQSNDGFHQSICNREICPSVKKTTIVLHRGNANRIAAISIRRSEVVRKVEQRMGAKDLRDVPRISRSRILTTSLICEKRQKNALLGPAARMIIENITLAPTTDLASPSSGSIPRCENVCVPSFAAP
jgi:hypothetical protein